MNYACCDTNRRTLVKEHPVLNGIDFLEVQDISTDPIELRQTTLLVHCLKYIAPGSIGVDNVIITGGESIRNIEVVSVEVGAATPLPVSPALADETILTVHVKAAGDFSTYTLQLVNDDDDHTPLSGFDVMMSAVDFSFKVTCPADIDCATDCGCSHEPAEDSDINYLAKDYSSFKQLMLDRMSLLMPQWTERNPADLGITLVELFAYIGDYLSYRQDAIATEAYLDTALQRISVKRHARLVDYFMHDGCNARVWLHVRLNNTVKHLTLYEKNTPYLTQFFTTVPNMPASMSIGSDVYRKLLEADAGAFEIIGDENSIILYPEHNEMPFYTWDAEECCLPKGATQATLAGYYPNLKPGMVLVLAEVTGPATGNAADADPTHRYPVKLTAVSYSYDYLHTLPVDSPLTSPPESPASAVYLPVTQITWHADDALPAALCISARNKNDYFNNVSIAWGNIVLADYGLTTDDTPLPSLVPEAALSYAAACHGHCDDTLQQTLVQPRYNPHLQQSPVTQAVPYLVNGKAPVSASAVRSWAMRDTMPAVKLYQTVDGLPTDEWLPAKDLIGVEGNAKKIVVETDNAGIAWLRFGDNLQGSRPASGTVFTAVVRKGNGIAGNVGAGTVTHMASNDPLVTGDENILSVSNPLPGWGGTEPEAMEHVKRDAPEAFRTQERAVTAADFEDVAKRSSNQVQRAACTFRWTGSWRTAFVTVDRKGSTIVDAPFENLLTTNMEKYRMAGQDIEIDGPVYVSLEIDMTVCVTAGYFAADVKADLAARFSSRILSNGTPGFFHPDNFTFGQTVYLSALYAVAQATEGIDSVRITKFQRQGQPDNAALLSGKLILNRLEIARLDNDRNFPSHGVLNLLMVGGK
ncbi:putative baseplate assembly protein [Deminuibacter soli]|uniref:Putative baseplate assembly protein n=1 Tax=Deminuibacter soli TaxID=2291815 RepID=A0A3E1NGD8_9BACT|nr:putative baseplate assembly protein [Deminuibacter soli]RFM26942.1 putative baseplate assembly protein [Deminuibacter soli]